MANYTVKKLDDIEAAYGGGYLRVRAALGVESFGMQMIQLPPNFEGYPEHDHAGDGQEEVYLVLSGGGEIEIEGERFAIDPETLVRVAAGTMRKLLPGPDGMRVLALGGIPGKAYEAPVFSQLGAGDSR